MPSKKKKYNARFPPARIKKIMQSDEEVGKVAQAVPVIISRALELFVESLLKKAEVVTHARNAKTLTPSHLKQCIMMESRFDFLRDLVSTVSDIQGDDEGGEPSTPQASTASSDGNYSFQPQQRAAQSNPGSSGTAAAGSSTSGRNEVPQLSTAQQHQLPSYASEIPEYMSLQNPQMQGNYVKQEDNQDDSNIYMPSTSNQIGGPPPSTMTSSSHQQLQQHQQQMYHIQQQQLAMHHGQPESYIPHAGPSGYHPQDLQQQQDARHFFYGQYDQNNGQIKMENPDNQRGYSEHPGYDYSRQAHHY